MLQSLSKRPAHDPAKHPCWHCKGTACTILFQMQHALCFWVQLPRSALLHLGLHNARLLLAAVLYFAVPLPSDKEARQCLIYAVDVLEATRHTYARLPLPLLAVVRELGLMATVAGLLQARRSMDELTRRGALFYEV